MKLGLFIIWAAIIWQIAAWTFAPRPAAKIPPEIDPRTTSTEVYLVEGREKQRRDGLRALEMPRDDLCSEPGYKKFTSGIGYYYYHRQSQMDRYPQNFGRTGADYIARQWASADDKRIDRLTREAYVQGYLKPGDFKPIARKIIVALIDRERVTGKGCSK